MCSAKRFLLLHCIINSLTIVSLWSTEKLATNDILINTEKSYTLRRIGIYSPNVVEKVVHIFIPIINPCLALPETSVCYYISRSNNINIIELATMMVSRQPVRMISSFDQDSVSRLIRKDINQVLTKHNPAEIINSNNSIVHFINDQFYYQTNREKESMIEHQNNVINVDPHIPYLHPTPAEKILKQMNNNEINFNFLPDADIKLFLNAIFSSFDRSYTISNIQETLNAFKKLIIGQSIFALRYCSFSSTRLLHSQPCLAISTSFVGIPADSTSTSPIFRLTALPIIFNGNQYVYSDLPKIIGINSIDQTIIIFDDDLDTNECIFSSIILCQYKSFSISLSKPSCLSQLFDSNQPVANVCSVSRSHNIQHIINVDDDIYLFDDIHQPYRCQIYTTSNKLIGTISINEASLARIPCNKSITCADIQLAASPCKPHRVIVIPSSDLFDPNLPYFVTPLNKRTQAFVSLYQTQTDESMNKFADIFMSKQPRFKQVIRDAAISILSFICLVFGLMFIHLYKIVKYKVKRKMTKLKEFVEDAIDF